MPVIGKPTNEPLNPEQGTVTFPAMEVPSFRYALAMERRTIKNVLVMAPFALGDCVCAEPAIRFIAKNFAGCKVSLLTEFPELFRHIPFEKVHNAKEVKPNWDDYFVLKGYYAADELQGEFTHNFNMAIGDYISICLLKGQIPVADRNVILVPASSSPRIEPQKVVVHAGRHWASKTFPKKWWDGVLTGLIGQGITPVLVGASVDDGKRGTVDVNADNCLDLRNKLSIMESVEVLQKAQVVLTNDSAPLHMAASGNAHIGFVSTVRHPDFVGHWRPDETKRNQWMHKMHDFSLGRMWQTTDVSPAKNGAKYDVIDQQTLISWLPQPVDVVKWTLEKLNGCH